MFILYILGGNVHFFMRILTHDELPESYDNQVQLLHLGAAWGIFDFNQIRKARKLGYPSSKYFAVYAVDGEEVFAKIEAIHIEYETTNGPNTVAGIGGVVTRRDKSRLGLARVLLEDVHQREKEMGINYSLLWTGRNNKAHNLYESLGYVDYYDPGAAVKKTANNNIISDGLNIRTATVDDTLLIDQLHDKITVNRLGFGKRIKNFMKLFFDLELVKPDTVRIFTKDDKVIGYAILQQNPAWIIVQELLIEPECSGEAISLLEKESKGSWLSFRDSFMHDSHAFLSRKGYSVLDYTYGTLMACDLNHQARQDEMLCLLGANNPKFVCHGLDHF